MVDGTPGRRVGLFIAGAQKAGTTALHAFLSEHPDIHSAATKEVHFFDRESHFSRDSVDYSVYHRCFESSVEPGALWLEATPIYLYWRPCAERIAAYNPNARLIIVLREPVARAYSQWKMEFSRATETESFPRAIALEEERRCAFPEEQHRVRSYVERGEYAAQIERFERLFPSGQLLLLRHDELRTAPHRVLARVCAFAGLAPFPAPPKIRDVFPLAPRKHLPALDPATRQRLNEHFAPWNALLAARTGWDLSDWG